MGIWSIAFNTLREAVRSKAYYALVIAGVLILAFWILLPFFTQGDDLGLLKEMEIGTVTLLMLLMAVLIAGTVISSELSDRTAMTLLSKPVSRPQFVLGKFCGVLVTVLSAMAILSVTTMGAVWLKAYMELEARGGATVEEALAILARDRLAHVWSVAPGLALAAMQVVLMSAIAVALAMRLPLVMTAIGVSGLYVLGHLLPRLKDMTVPRSAGRAFMVGVCWVMPRLDFYNVGNEIAFGHPIPWYPYVASALLYTVLYATVALLVAMMLFRERELT
jgi:hypothetical protein